MSRNAISLINRRLTVALRSSGFVRFTRLVGLISVTIGSLALITTLSILEGFDQTLRQKAVTFSSHISLLTINNQPIDWSPRISSMLRRKFQNINSVTPFIQKEGLIRGPEGVEGLMLKGVDPTAEQQARPKTIVSGVFTFTDVQANEILLGRSLCQKLDAKPGDSVVITVIHEGVGGRKDPMFLKVKLVGEFSSGMSQYDDSYAYLPIGTAGMVANLPGGMITGLDIMSTSIGQVPALAAELEEYVGYPFYALTVFDLHQSMFNWIDLQKEPIPIVLGLISIVAAMNVLTSLLILVSEKTRTIGILRALGLRRRGIIALFFRRGIVTGVAGTSIGLAIGLLFCLVQTTWKPISLNPQIYYVDAIPVSLEAWHYVFVGVASVALCGLASLVPAWIAAAISPVRALRFS